MSFLILLTRIVFLSSHVCILLLNFITHQVPGLSNNFVNFGICQFSLLLSNFLSCLPVENVVAWYFLLLCRLTLFACWNRHVTHRRVECGISFAEWWRNQSWFLLNLNFFIRLTPCDLFSRWKSSPVSSFVVLQFHWSSIRMLCFELRCSFLHEYLIQRQLSFIRVFWLLRCGFLTVCCCCSWFWGLR